MKTFSKLIIFAFAFCGFCGCGDDGHVVLPEPVTYARIAGTWQLTQWNGETLNDSRYAYIVLDRRDRVFDMYHNLDSSKSRHLTGAYVLRDDEDLGTLIDGVYDHGSGFWDASYVVSELSDDSMTWVKVSEGRPEISVYTRRASLPGDILNVAGGF